MVWIVLLASTRSLLVWRIELVGDTRTAKHNQTPTIAKKDTANSHEVRLESQVLQHTFEPKLSGQPPHAKQVQNPKSEQIQVHMVSRRYLEYICCVSGVYMGCSNHNPNMCFGNVEDKSDRWRCETVCATHRNVGTLFVNRCRRPNPTTNGDAHETIKQSLFVAFKDALCFRWDAGVSGDTFGDCFWRTKMIISRFWIRRVVICQNTDRKKLR